MAIGDVFNRIFSELFEVPMDYRRAGNEKLHEKLSELFKEYLDEKINVSRGTLDRGTELSRKDILNLLENKGAKRELLRGKKIYTHNANNPEFKLKDVAELKDEKSLTSQKRRSANLKIMAVVAEKIQSKKRKTKKDVETLKTVTKRIRKTKAPKMRNTKETKIIKEIRKTAEKTKKAKTAEKKTKEVKKPAEKKPKAIVLNDNVCTISLETLWSEITGTIQYNNGKSDPWYYNAENQAILYKKIKDKLMYVSIKNDDNKIKKSFEIINQSSSFNINIENPYYLHLEQIEIPKEVTQVHERKYIIRRNANFSIKHGDDLQRTIKKIINRITEYYDINKSNPIFLNNENIFDPYKAAGERNKFTISTNAEGKLFGVSNIPDARDQIIQITINIDFLNTDEKLFKSAHIGNNFIQNIGSLELCKEYNKLCDKKDNMCFKNYLIYAKECIAPKLSQKIIDNVPAAPVSKEYIINTLNNLKVNYTIYNGLYEIIDHHNHNKSAGLHFIIDCSHIIPVLDPKSLSYGTNINPCSAMMHYRASKMVDKTYEEKEQITIENKWNYIDKSKKQVQFDNSPFLDITKSPKVKTNYIDEENLYTKFWDHVAETKNIPNNSCSINGEIMGFFDHKNKVNYKNEDHELFDKYSLPKPFPIISCVNHAYSQLFASCGKAGLYYSSKEKDKKYKVKFDINKAYLSICNTEQMYPIFFPHEEIKKYNSEIIENYNLYHTSRGWMYGDELILLQKFNEQVSRKKIEIFMYYKPTLIIPYRFGVFDKIPMEELKKIYTKYIGLLAYTKDKVIKSHVTYGIESANYFHHLGCNVTPIPQTKYINSFEKKYGKIYVENDSANDIVSKLLKNRASSSHNNNNDDYDSDAEGREEEDKIKYEKNENKKRDATIMHPFYAVTKTKSTNSPLTFKFVNWRILALCTIKLLNKIFDDIDKQRYKSSDILEIRIDGAALRNAKNFEESSTEIGGFRYYYYDEGKDIPPSTHNFKKCKELSIPNFLTNEMNLTYGRAGTGKSYTLKNNAEKDRTENKNVVILAPTRTAAKRVEGQTFHRYFGFENVATYKISSMPNTSIHFDEISMCNYNILFELYMLQCTGSQVNLYGDFRQLPPVYKSNPEPPENLNEIILKKICKCVELTEMHRFSINDKLYKISESLNLSEIPRKKLHIDINTRCLAYTNKTTDYINNLFSKLKTHQNAPYVCKESTKDYDNGELREYKDIPHRDLKYFKLAFCTTIHIKQGGQFENNHNVLLFDHTLYDKKLAYTAVTRCIKYDQLAIGTF